MDNLTSLTSPADKKEIVESNNLDKDNLDVYGSRRREEPLSMLELDDAVKDLHEKAFVGKYRPVERTFADPSIMNQQYCLVSFVPSAQAKPDEDGCYGMIKVRGTYNTMDECNERAEFLIQNIDSYHKIYTTYVGRPFPATSSSKWSAETAEVDIKKKITKVVSEDIKKQKAEEQREINEIKERERKLLDSSKDESVDPFEEYITMRVKKAQLTWTYLETQKKMEEMKQSILKVREEIEQNDKEHPEYIENYREKYYSARRESGLKEDDDSSFIAYLGDDRDSELGF
jgi:hypothetical protein